MLVPDGSEETDVLGNYKKYVGQRKHGYQMTHGQSPPTESIDVFYVSVPGLLQFGHLQIFRTTQL